MFQLVSCIFLLAAMEAGLSIGFCEPSEIDDWSRLFTIFYVLLG